MKKENIFSLLVLCISPRLVWLCRPLCCPPLPACPVLGVSTLLLVATALAWKLRWRRPTSPPSCAPLTSIAQPRRNPRPKSRWRSLPDPVAQNNSSANTVKHTGWLGPSTLFSHCVDKPEPKSEPSQVQYKLELRLSYNHNPSPPMPSVLDPDKIQVIFVDPDPILI